MSAIKGFISNIFSAVSDNLISGGAYYLVAKAVAVTAVITVLAWIIAAVLGALLSYLMCYEKKLLSNIGRGFCFVFRSIPVLLIVWLLYYCFFGGSTLSGIIIMGLGIGLWGAGHFSEILADAVKKEQARMNKSVRNKLQKVYYSLVVPQAMEDSMLHIKRLAVHILQWTTIAGYIGVNDLTEVMYGIGQRTMYPFFSIFFSAVLYLLATIVIEWIYGIIAKRVHRMTEVDLRVSLNIAEPRQERKKEKKRDEEIKAERSTEKNEKLRREEHKRAEKYSAKHKR